MAIEEFHRGTHKWIVRMPGAEASFNAAVAGVSGTRAACPRQLQRYLERIADGHALHNREQFRHEGGGIYAVKAHCGLRAYGWFDSYKNWSAFVVSHYILKKHDKFREEDRLRVEQNRKVYTGHIT